MYKFTNLLLESGFMIFDDDTRDVTINLPFAPPSGIFELSSLPVPNHWDIAHPKDILHLRNTLDNDQVNNIRLQMESIGMLCHDDEHDGFLDVQDFIEYQTHQSSSRDKAIVAAAIAILTSENLRYMSQSVCVNPGGKIDVPSSFRSFSDLDVALSALGGYKHLMEHTFHDIEGVIIYGAAAARLYRKTLSQFSRKGKKRPREARYTEYKVDTTCRYVGTETQLSVFGGGERIIASVTHRRDNRYVNSNRMIYTDIQGKLRKAYMRGNHMFVTGFRNGSVMDYNPVRSLQGAGIGVGIDVPRYRLDAPTTAMFDNVVRTINDGNNYLCKWYIAKALGGEIKVMPDEGVHKCSYFLESVKNNNDQLDRYGPTEPVKLFQDQSLLGFLFNVGDRSFVVAYPYDWNGWEICRVSDNRVTLKRVDIPQGDRYYCPDVDPKLQVE